ncbi:MAG: hypothetical protein GTO13_15480 [Proteobacteria bacterium]|nr:hypothetical protein [Pseudomonadota bacterium]
MNFTIGEQNHKRLSKEFVEGVLETFNDDRIGEEKVCEILGVRREHLHRLRKRSLRSVMGEKPFELYGRKESVFHRLLGEVQQWLHQEIIFIRQKAEVYRGRFNSRGLCAAWILGSSAHAKGAAAAKGKAGRVSHL